MLRDVCGDHLLRLLWSPLLESSVMISATFVALLFFTIVGNSVKTFGEFLDKSVKTSVATWVDFCEYF